MRKKISRGNLVEKARPKTRKIKKLVLDKFRLRLMAFALNISYFPYNDLKLDVVFGIFLRIMLEGELTKDETINLKYWAEDNDIQIGKL